MANFKFPLLIIFVLSFSQLHLLQFHHDFFSSFPVKIGLLIISILLYAYSSTRSKPVYLVDFSCHQPTDSCKISSETFFNMAKGAQLYTEETIQFMTRILNRSGLGDDTYAPRCMLTSPPTPSMFEARHEAELVIFGALNSLFKKTGVEPRDIGIFIVNCSLFNPNPSLSSMIVNRYKLKTDVKTYNLSGMGCSAGAISVDLAAHLLKANPNTYAVIVSTENMTLSMYRGNDRSMLVPNCIFRAAVFLLISVAYLPLLNELYWSTLTSLKPPVRVVADLLVTNGTIFTSEKSLPFADSMAIRNGRILKVGSFTTLKDFVGDGTVEVNLEGKVVVPGLIDSHVHLISGGLQMAQVGLRGVSQKEEFCKMVKDAVQNAKEGSWILGGGWNNDFWGGELPSASWIDEISPHNPVWLIRMDGHMALANSLTLKIAGVTSLTEDPVGGTIMRLPSGEPTGLLIDAAMELVTSFVKEVSVDERREALVRASKYALTRGVTTVVDLGRYYPGTTDELSWNDFEDVYLWADSTKKMMIRTCLFFPITTWSRLSDLKLQKGHVLSEWLYLGGVKAFIDGSLGSNSALFYEEYIDTPNNHGLEVMDPEILSNLTMAADKSGLQVAIHAIGDKANDMILDMYKSVAAANGERDRRFRIEHAQHLAPGSSDRFGRHHIVASVQPDHLLDDADTAPKKLGFDRAEKESYLFQSLLNGNALVAFGSDWPVADINPLHSIRTAVKRIPPKWDHAWIPSECISFTNALTAHTISAAQAAFLDDHLGSISPAKLADFVVLSTNSWDEFSKDGSASVLATYVGGKQVHP